MKIVKWYSGLSPIAKAVINSILAAIAFFISAIAPEEIVNYLLPLNGFQKILVYIGVFFAILILYSILFIPFKFNRQKMEDETKAENELMLSAHIKCDKIVTDGMVLYNNSCTIENLLVGTPLETIKKLIAAAYETLDDYYGRSVNPDERIKFEATFMSKSYIDGGITIPASRNRENRAPTSLQLRQNDRTFYDNTITAKIYRERKPSIHIIEDTSDPQSGYEMLYPNQQERIQSSIIFPVLSNENILLGTLVIHCDKKHFFQQNKKKFWIEILEIFAKRLALEKLRLDGLVQHATIHNIDITSIKNIF